MSEVVKDTFSKIGCVDALGVHFGFVSIEELVQRLRVRENIDLH